MELDQGLALFLEHKHPYRVFLRFLNCFVGQQLAVADAFCIPINPVDAIIAVAATKKKTSVFRIKP
ncbi:MAG TPA: hypothetical protein VE130_04660 [Nitrososphaeraceae archaeon]|nr:hypothetical protein [Nitrososphaeraceae archaeon]